MTGNPKKEALIGSEDLGGMDEAISLDATGLKAGIP
jgi:hypothetical protein